MYYDVDLDIDYKAIGRRIRAARERKGLKQHNLAALAEVAATNISHIERGVAKVSLPALLKIANSLEVSIDEHVFTGELAEIVDKCTDKELKLITETVKAMYDTIHGRLG